MLNTLSYHKSFVWQLNFSQCRENLLFHCFVYNSIMCLKTAPWIITPVSLNMWWCPFTVKNNGSLLVANKKCWTPADYDRVIILSWKVFFISDDKSNDYLKQIWKLIMIVMKYLNDLGNCLHQHLYQQKMIIFRVLAFQKKKVGTWSIKLFLLHTNSNFI